MRDAVRVGVILLLMAGVALLARFTPLGGWLADAARGLARFADRPWAAPAWIVAYGLGGAVGAPAAILTLTGGVAFGFPLGAVLNLLGGTLGATLAFLEGRYLARDLVERRLWRWVDKIGPISAPRVAFWVFLRLRLIAIIPANALNFAAGATPAPLHAYVAGSALGFIPATVTYSYFAHALAAGGTGGHTAVVDILVVLGACMLLACLPTVLKLSRRTPR